MKGLASSLWYGVWTAESRVNSHRRCWGRWSMRWYMSSRQAVGWSTYFFLPGSGCFCWRPGGWKRKRRIDGKEKRERSQYGLVCDTLHQVIIQPRWRGKKQIHLAQNTNKKGGSKTNQWGGRSVNETYISQSKVKAFANRAGEMISHHRAKLFQCVSVCPPLSSLIPSISSFYGPRIVGPLGQSRP